MKDHVTLKTAVAVHIKQCIEEKQVEASGTQCWQWIKRIRKW